MAMRIMKDGWYDLGLAYAGANNHAEAIAAFRKQIELDPNHKLRKRRSGDGTAANRENRRGDRGLSQADLKWLRTKSERTRISALLLAQLGRDADARTELEAAAAIPPDDPETKMALAQVYGRLGEKAQGAGTDEGADGSAGGDSGQDIYAAASRHDIDPAQTETRCAAGALRHWRAI